MSREERLVMLKHDLQRTQKFTAQDGYLLALLDDAEAKISEEGIVLQDTVRDGMLQVNYAAYLYRKRADSEGVMPRSLRRSLNQRLLTQKGAADVT